MGALAWFCELQSAITQARDVIYSFIHSSLVGCIEILLFKKDKLAINSSRRFYQFEDLQIEH